VRISQPVKVSPIAKLATGGTLPDSEDEVRLQKMLRHWTGRVLTLKSKIMTMHNLFLLQDVDGTCVLQLKLQTFPDNLFLTLQHLF